MISNSLIWPKRIYLIPVFEDTLCAKWKPYPESLDDIQYVRVDLLSEREVHLLESLKDLRGALDLISESKVVESDINDKLELYMNAYDFIINEYESLKEEGKEKNGVRNE